MIIDEWVLLFEKDQDASLLLLINGLLWSGTVQLDLTGLRNEDGDGDPGVILATHQDAIDANSNLGKNMLGSKKKAAQEFQRSFQDFWSKWAQTIAQQSIAGVEFIDTELVPWLTVMSASQFRPLRQAASIASFCLILGMGRALKDLSSQLERASKLTKSLNNSNLAESLTFQIAATEKLIQTIFSSIFIQRFRDVDVVIREASLELLGRAIEANPSSFLDNHYLRYLGWGLSDRSTEVRKTALQSLNGLYCDSSMHPAMSSFTERFRPRLIEMAGRDCEAAIRKEAFSLLSKMNEFGLVEMEELMFLDQLVKSFVALPTQAIPLLKSRIEFVSLSLSETAVCGFVDHLCNYLGSLCQGLEIDQMQLVSEHLVGLLVPTTDSLKDFGGLIENVAAEMGWVVLEAAARAFVYPPAVTATGIIVKSRVIPSQPTGMALSKQLATIVGPTIVDALKGGELSDVSLTAAYDLLLLVDASEQHGLNQNLADAIALSYNSCNKGSMLRSHHHVCKAAIRAWSCLSAVESLGIENAWRAALRFNLNGNSTFNLVKAAYLMSVVKLPESSAEFYNQIYQSMQSNTCTTEEDRITFMAGLQLLYQDLLWRLVERRASSEQPCFEAVVPFRDELLALCQQENDDTSMLAFSLCIYLDVISLFGPAQTDIPESWRFKTDHDFSYCIQIVEKIMLSNESSDCKSKLIIGLTRLFLVNVGFSCYGKIFEFLGRWSGIQGHEMLIDAAIEKVTKDIVLADLIPCIAPMAVAAASSDSLDASLERILNVARHMANHLKRSSGLAAHADALRSTHVHLMESMNLDDLKGANALAQLSSLYVPVLPPADNAANTVMTKVAVLKSQIGTGVRRYEDVRHYIKSIEKHISKSSAAGLGGRQRGRPRLQLTPQKRSGSSLALQTTAEELENDSSKLSSEKPSDEEDNAGTLMEEFEDLRVETPSSSSSPVPLRKKTVLRN
jgi:hypothetical protein